MGNFLGTLNGWSEDLAAIKAPLEALVNTAVEAAEASGPVIGYLDEIETVAGIEAAVTTLAGISAQVSAVSAVAAHVSTLAPVAASISTLAPIAANITTVAGVSGAVTTVAGISAHVSAVASIDDEVTTLSGIAANVTAVAGVAASVSTVAAIDDEVIAVAGAVSEVVAVAGNLTAIQNASTAANMLLSAAAGGHIYDTNAAMLAATAAIDDGGYALVLVDETDDNHAIIWRKLSGSFTKKLDLSTGAPPGFDDLTGSPTDSALLAAALEARLDASLVSAFALTLLDDADAAAMRTTLGLAIGSAVQAYNGKLAAIAGLTAAADRIAYFTGANSAAIATLTSFGRSLIDDADAAAGRVTLGLEIGVNVQAYDAELAAIAGLTSAANRLPYFTGAGTAALATFSSAARALLDDASAAAMRDTLELGTAAVAAASAFVAATGGTATDLTIDGFGEAVAEPSAGTAFTIDVAKSLHRCPTTGNATFTMPAPAKGKSGLIAVEYGGAHTVSWAGGSRKWAGGSPPDPTSVNGKIDQYGYACWDGSTWIMWDAGRNF